MSRRGVSPLISMILVVAIVVMAVGIVLNVALPLIQELRDTGAIQDQIRTFNDLDDMIRAVATEGRFATRTPRISFDRGHIRFDNTSGTLYYELETRSNIISTHSSRMIRDVRLSANAEVSLNETRINGTRCYRVENQYLDTCIRAIDAVFTPSNHPDLSGYWRLDEGTGQWVNDSMRTSNATRGSSTAAEGSDPDWSAGIQDGGLSFDSGETVTIPQTSELASTLSTDNLTIAFWINPSPDTSSWSSILSWQTVNGSGDTHTARVETMSGQNDSIYTRFIAENSSCGDNTGDGGFWARSNDMGVIPGQWNLYAVTYNGSTITEYMNGERQVASTDGCRLADLNSDITLHGLPNGEIIDEVRIYNRSLFPGEISWMQQQRGDPQFINTSELLLSYRNKDLGETLDQKVTISANKQSGTSYGTGYTAPGRVGNFLGSGTVIAHVASEYGFIYNVTIELISGSDFLLIEATK